MSKSPFPYALAAIDIDDTLVGPDKRIGRENRRAVGRLQALECRVVLASGRRHANMLRYCDELGLDDYVVSSHGARVEHARTGSVLHSALLSPSDAAALVAEGLGRGLAVMLWHDDGIYAGSHSAWVDSYRWESGDDPVTIADLRTLAALPAEKVVWAAEPAVIAAVAAEVGPLHAGRLSATITEDWYLEFTAPGANKGDGVAAVARHLGIARDAVLAFGDGNNDTPLLSWAGMGVAMPHGARRPAPPRGSSRARATRSRRWRGRWTNSRAGSVTPAWPERGVSSNGILLANSPGESGAAGFLSLVLLCQLNLGG